MAVSSEQGAGGMIDWADKTAIEMFSAQDGDVGLIDVADALRQARIDALEEAARAAEGFVGCDNIAADIRALKDKQP